MLLAEHRLERCMAAVDRVIRIQELYAAGLSSARIARLLPCMRDAKKVAFSPVMERERYLEAPSELELGTLVAEELAFAAARDDGASK